MERHREEQPLGELLSELTADIRTLLRDEVDLAKTEMTGKIVQVGKDLAYLAVGAAVVYAGLLGLMAFLIIILAEAMSPWVSALLVSVVVTGIGYFFVQRGISDLRSRSLVPQQTLDTLKEDREWIRNQTK